MREGERERGESRGGSETAIVSEGVGKREKGEGKKDRVNERTGRVTGRKRENNQREEDRKWTNSPIFDYSLVYTQEIAEFLMIHRALP